MTVRGAITVRHSRVGKAVPGKSATILHPMGNPKRILRGVRTAERSLGSLRIHHRSWNVASIFSSSELFGLTEWPSQFSSQAG